MSKRNPLWPTSKQLKIIERQLAEAQRIQGNAPVASGTPMTRVAGYRKSLNRRLDEKWEWACPVWFGPGMFANAWIKGSRPFDTQKEAIADMQQTLPLFGITKETPVL